jgi:hypothetical protein
MQPTAGRAVGEQTESFWSLLKQPAKLARYMADARHRDWLNLVMEFTSCQAQEGLAALLQSRIRKNASKIGAYLSQACRVRPAACGLRLAPCALRPAPCA